MLKRFIQLLLEKFLENKKEWVGNQAMPNDTAARVTVNLEITPGEIIAPFDGYVTLYTRCYEWGQIWNENRGVLISAKGTTYQRIQMPIAKGSKVGYEFANSVDGVREAVLVFVPSVGASDN